ncbi:hypothetical protein GJAV_G00193480 [Gymnothorax javanicus]|nr:hypothetical protein GJAV_G00193480 [Gymnothorax javanicus]
MSVSSKTMDNKLLVDVPQLSNEMQLSIMNKVKSGQLTIEDALSQARRGTYEQQSAKVGESQYNFCVYKHNRYIWQKRILQIDFKTKMMCSIEKGIIKRQLPFSSVRSCDDSTGTKFSVSFSGRHDYELEATSLEDKQKIMQLVHRIIHENIYEEPLHSSEEESEPAPGPKSLREGQLDLQRGGLASIKWVRFVAQLHQGEMTLVPLSRQEISDTSDPVRLPVPSTLVIHISDGKASVETPRSCDTFIVLTNKNEYLFRVPVSDQAKSTDAIKKERDAWVRAIDRLCLQWKRQSQAESQNIYEVVQLPTDCRAGGAEEQGSGRMQNRESGPAQYQGKGHEMGPEPEENFDEDRLPTSPPTSPPPVLPKPIRPTPNLPIMPPPPPALPPPPLPSKTSTNTLSRRTKAFHWDRVPQDKIGKTVWARCNSDVQIDTLRLYQQFSVQEMGHHGALESTNNVNIMLNDKVAHNFNIFLKSFPVAPGELKDRLCIVTEEEGGLTDEHITILRRYVPTPDDVEMYKSHKGELSELHVVDQYMMEMCSIPYLSARLDLLLTLRELPVSMEDLLPLITQKIRMCNQLASCRAFLSVLEYLLAVGNYLNENAGKEKARGFRLSSLTKLSQLRGKSRKFTLLHALVEQIVLHEPQLATFSQELTEFETVPGASIKGLVAEVDVLKNELQKVVQYKKTQKVKNQGAQQQKFLRDLKTAIERYSADLSQLTKKCEEMKKLYSDVLVKFGEPPEQDSQELFGWVCTFAADFKSVHAEMS